MPQQIYEPHIIEDPSLPFIFHFDHAKGDSVMTCLPNWHANTEILCCTNGCGYVVCDAEKYPFSAGDIIVINAYRLHIVVGDPAADYYCLIADRDFCTANGIPTESVRFCEHIQSPALYRDYERVVGAFQITDHSRVPAIRHAILGLMLSLYRDFVLTQNAEDPKKNYTAERIKEAISYIRQHYAEKLTLAQLADHVGVSKYHLSHDFKKFSGQTIFEHLNTIRCKEAKRLIENGSSVSAAAISCGFENMSYFSRTYKKYIGCLPSKKSSR